MCCYFSKTVLYLHSRFFIYFLFLRYFLLTRDYFHEIAVCCFHTTVAVVVNFLSYEALGVVWSGRPCRFCFAHCTRLQRGDKGLWTTSIWFTFRRRVRSIAFESLCRLTTAYSSTRKPSDNILDTCYVFPRIFVCVFMVICQNSRKISRR